MCHHHAGARERPQQRRLGAPLLLAMCAVVWCAKEVEGAAGDAGGATVFKRLTENAISEFGWSLAGLGDLDGDGFADLAAGAWHDNSESGRAFVLFLASDGSVRSTVELTHDDLQVGAGDQFGYSLGAIGDLDGDGTVDLAVGAHKDGSGAVYVVFMNTNGSVRSLTKISKATEPTLPLENGDWFSGGQMASMGDLDGDGVVDLAVGAWGDDDGGAKNTGAVYELFLTASGRVRAFTKISMAYLPELGLVAADHFGTGVASPGDVNSDGIVDLAVGAFADDDTGTSAGSVWVFF